MFAREWSTVINSEEGGGAQRERFALNDVKVKISSVLSQQHKLHVSSVTFQENTEIMFIHGSFIQWRIPNAFVLRDGALVGMITRNGLKKALTKS